MGEVERLRRADMKWEYEAHLNSGSWDTYLGGCECKGCVERADRGKNENRARYRHPTQQAYNEYLQMRFDKAEQKARQAKQKKEEQEANEREKREKANEKARERRAKKTEERKRAAKEEAEKAFSDAVAKETARLLKEEQTRAARGRECVCRRCSSRGSNALEARAGTRSEDPYRKAAFASPTNVTRRGTRTRWRRSGRDGLDGEVQHRQVFILRQGHRALLVPLS
jgi:hypothetical protein